MECSITASIFDLQHTSFVDGPGIRTTVFFKGCNLRCAWCHNPESQKRTNDLLFYSARCTGCGLCRDQCPNHAIRITDEGKAETDRLACTVCGACAEICPGKAKMIAGRKASVSELLPQILSDKPFYQASGGGVTFSGGEPLLQAEFVRQLAAACKENGVSTAIDTAGAVPYSVFESVLPYTDLFLYDVKCITWETHKKGTGADNDLILGNLKRLSEKTEIPIIIRTPVIPGFNDDPEEQRKIDDFVSTIRHTAHEKLPYHELGKAKYAALGRKGMDIPLKQNV